MIFCLNWSNSALGAFCNNKKIIHNIIQLFFHSLKRGRERIPLFVPAFRLERPAFLTVHRSWPFLWTFLTVSYRFYLKTVLKRSETLMKRSKAFMRTARNVGRSETFMLNMTNGPKRLQNHAQVHASKTKESLWVILMWIKKVLETFKLKES